MKKPRSMISFDWAMKRLLRQKDNFDVLEGFLCELLLREVTIKSIGESEGNSGSENEKTNMVDILAEMDSREIVIVELQYDSVDDYFHRMLFGASRAITNYMTRGAPYSMVRKIYSVNIVYFDLGRGDDYVYRGFTNFRGIHTDTELHLTPELRLLYQKTVVGDIHPEYYVIKVNGYERQEPQSPLDEWIYYFKYNEIEDHFTAKGLDRARELLQFDRLSKAEQEQYLRKTDEKLLRDGAIRTALFEGHVKGEAKGLEKGEAIGLAIGLEKGEAKGLEKGRAEGKSERDQLEAENARLLERIALLEQQASKKDEKKE